MDKVFLGLLDALIARSEKAVESLKTVSANYRAVSEAGHNVTEVGYAKEALWFIYFLWTSDEYKNLESWVKVFADGPK